MSTLIPRDSKRCRENWGKAVLAGFEWCIVFVLMEGMARRSEDVPTMSCISIGSCGSYAASALRVLPSSIPAGEVLWNKVSLYADVEIAGAISLVQRDETERRGHQGSIGCFVDIGLECPEGERHGKASSGHGENRHSCSKLSIPGTNGEALEHGEDVCGYDNNLDSFISRSCAYYVASPSAGWVHFQDPGWHVQRRVTAGLLRTQEKRVHCSPIWCTSPYVLALGASLFLRIHAHILQTRLAILLLFADPEDKVPLQRHCEKARSALLLASDERIPYTSGIPNAGRTALSVACRDPRAAERARSYELILLMQTAMVHASKTQAPVASPWRKVLRGVDTDRFGRRASSASAARHAVYASYNS
ncbi:hypothetical protein FIBSPDRAFT_899956 [Athelia psychrophila]|uniref:Uncharacterized protein n=1 Tax=Athelia psychrophila TaxID=1759441 RepID=A0A165Z335_9AGAM|nr:hypothetical protein FIBSPDRAFT_899956 [Fibularhizoctonia sp. CBS 109695]